MKRKPCLSCGFRPAEDVVLDRAGRFVVVGGFCRGCLPARLAEDVREDQLDAEQRGL